MAAWKEKPLRSLFEARPASLSLAVFLTLTYSVSLLSMESAGAAVTQTRKSSALLSVMNVNASPLAYTSGANYTDKPCFLDFPSPRSLFTSSHSSSLSFSPSRGLSDTWRQLRDVTSKPSVPWAYHWWKLVQEISLPSLPLDFPPFCHYWWSDRRLEYKRAETETSHFPVRNYTSRSFS